MGNKTRSVEGGRNWVEKYVRFVAGNLVDKGRCRLEYAKVLHMEPVRDCGEEKGMGRHSWRRNITAGKPAPATKGYSLELIESSHSIIGLTKDVDW